MIMAEGMITAGTKPQWFQEEKSPIASAIATILMQVRAGAISKQQAAQFFADMVARGVPAQVIENIMDTPPTEMEGARQGGDARAVGQTPIRTSGPTMATYGDVRSVLEPGPANIRTDPDPVGWPGEDFKKFPIEEVKKTIPPMGGDFSAPPVNRNVVGRAAPPLSAMMGHEDSKTAALRNRASSQTTPLQAKAKYMAGPTQPKYTASLLPSSQGRQPATGRVSRRGNPHAR